MLPAWLKQVTLFLVLVNAASVAPDILVPPRDELMIKAKAELLPKSATPKKYNLYLQPDITEGTFKGNVAITIHIEESTNTIMLHAGENLNITQEEVTITYLGNEITTNPVISRITRNATADKMTIIVKEELHRDALYEVKLLFSGYLEGSSYPNRRTNNPLHYFQSIKGFMGEKYVNIYTRNMSFFAATDMMKTNARRVFPCFDEPSYKATFEIVVGHLKNMTALSVMPLSYTEIDEVNKDYVLDHFAPTPPISTFSVGVLVSNLENNSSTVVQTSQGSYTVRLFYSKVSPMLEQIEKYTRLIPKVMEYLDNYFGVPYPLPQINIVFISKLSTLNTEALGLLVCDEYMANIVGYIDIMIKQWTSHLATPQQWSYSNITKDLTSYLKEDIFSKITDDTWPQLKSYYYDDTDYIYNAYSKHKDFEHYSPPQRDMDFLQMLNNTLTEHTVKAAVRNLILNNKYSTYTEGMLWDEITKQALKDKTLPDNASVGEILKSWLDYYNYPVLTVTRMYQQNSAKLEQRIFFTEYPRNTTEEEEGKLWWIPVTYFTPDNMDSNSHRLAMWMKKERSAMLSKLPDANSFIIVNPTNAGFFLANYDLHNWGLIAESLKTSNPLIPAKTRKNVLRSALLLSQGGELNYCTAFNMTLFLANETDHDVWIPLFDWLADLRRHLTWTPYEQILDEYVNHMLKPAVQSLTTIPFNPNTQKRSTFELRAKQQLSEAGNKQYRLRHPFEGHYDFFNMSDNETGAIVHCPTFMREEPEKWSNHSLDIYWILVSVYDHHSNVEKCPGFLEVIQRILDQMSDENETFSISTWQDSVNLLTSGPISFNLTLKYFMEKFHDIRQRLYHMRDFWLPLVRNICRAINSREHLDKFVKFYEENKKKFGYSQETINDAIKVAAKDIEWQENNLPVIEKCFDQVIRRHLKY